MLDDDALGCASRAAGVEHIGGVGGCQRAGRQSAGCRNFVIKRDQPTPGAERRSGQCGHTHHHRRRTVVGDKALTGGRQLWIDRHIGAARQQDAEHAHDQIDTPRGA